MGTFAESLAFGQIGESLISQWLQRAKGYSVLPAYDIATHEARKGPRLLSTAGDLVVPDILAIRGDTVRWIEAKHKTSFVWNRTYRHWVTGIDTYLFTQYQQVAALTPFPVWLLFLHQTSIPGPRGPSPTGLYGQELGKLAATIDHEGLFGRKPMRYWTPMALCRLATLEEVHRYASTV